MKRICAWCLKDMGSVKASGAADDEVSHGVCETCVDNLTFQQGVSIQRYLDGLPHPVFLVDGNVEVRAVNSLACETLGKQSVEMIQQLGGNVFECKFSRLPGGCGRTIHCSGCTIRGTVNSTFATGEPMSMVPATLKRDAMGSQSEIALYITTVKVDSLVMLRIDTL